MEIHVSKRIKQNKEKQIIDSQIQQEMDRKQKEKLDNIESENRWIASITAELDLEKQKKHEKKQKQMKEYRRLVQEQEEAKLKAEKRRREDKEYDVQCLQMQDDYLKLQEEKRIQERKRREDRNNLHLLRDDFSTVFDQQNLKETEYDLKLQSEIKQKEDLEELKSKYRSQKIKNDKEDLRKILQKQIFDKEQNFALERIKDCLVAKEICDKDKREKIIEDQKIKASKERHIQNIRDLDKQIEQRSHADGMDAREFSINKQLFREMEKIEEMIKSKRNEVETKLIFSPY